MNHQAIGVIDAGLGGLTVLQELRQRLPNESYIFCGDSKNTPYSGKAHERVHQYIDQMLHFLEKRHVKLVVIACNMISAVLKDELDSYPMPLLDIITPAAEAAVADDYPNILVFCPPGTAQSGVHREKILQRSPHVHVLTQSSATLAKLIDNGMEDTAAIESEVARQANAIQQQLAGRHAEIILGCTHFSFIQDMLIRELPGLKILNPGKALGEAAAQYLTEHRLLSTAGKTGQTQIFSNGDPAICRKMAELSGIHSAEIQSQEF